MFRVDDSSSVTSLNLSGKPDVHKANSNERAILRRKMKKELENVLLLPQFKVFHNLLSFFFFFSLLFFFKWVILKKRWQQRRTDDWTTGLHESWREGWKGIWFAESVFEMKCNAGALKSIGAPRESLQKMSCVATSVGCERHQFKQSLNQCHCFIWCGSV